MTLLPALRFLALSAVIPVIAGCSGSSSDHAAGSDSGIAADGGSAYLDGNRDANLGKDAPAGGRDGRAEIDGAGGNESGIRDGDSSDARGPIAAEDAIRGPDSGGAADATPDVGGVRDAGTGLTADVTEQETGLRDAVSGGKADAAANPADSATAASTGNATADRLVIAAASCGPQSPRTVPVGWQMVLAGDKGCTLYAPPGWLTIGAGTPNTFVVEDQSRVVGSSVMAGVDTTGTATCTPHGIATWLFANNKDCVGFQELYWKDGVDNVAGIQLPRGDLIYSCMQGGIPIVGYLVVQIEGTWPLCNLLAFAFWMPETQIEARTCTLTQTLNSIQCPQGGTGCEDASCRTDCIADGNLSGACTSDGSCTCTN